MSKQYEHIRRIRKEKYWLDDSNRKGEQNPLLKDLQQSINKLSRDLYRKNSHFLLELIQNAEDNDYDCDNPTLSFSLVKADPTNSNASNGALVISNNEIGFSEDNMEAMCSIGSSFKEKLKGYIGEKGIGFKSVFKITQSPYIYSNGYQVRFQDKIKEIGLGYIVPEWVDSVPKVANHEQTTIILPLNNGKIVFSEVSKMMREFTPETILFLTKIRQLRFFVEGEYDISISKSVDNEYVVCLTITTSVDEQTSIIHKEYLLYTKNFTRPADLLVEGREDVFDRDITISFPVGNTANEGAVYAYLPVLENTGMPFILNADFLVPGSREMINEDSKWNKWLRDQIPDLFVEAFVKLSKKSIYQYDLFCRIPIETKINNSFFAPVAKQITERLSKLAIIPTVPRGKFAFPLVSKSSRDFRKVISSHKMPSALKDRLITEKLQSTVPSEVFQTLGISPITSIDVVTYLQDIEWISTIGFDGLVQLYRFLASKKKQYEEDNLRQYKIVPIKEKKKTVFSCVAIQPIYFEATKHEIEVLNEKPDCIKTPIRFLDRRFYDLLREYEDIKEWMKEVIQVKSFSLKDYSFAVAVWFKENHKNLNDEQFVDVSNYILDHVAINIEIEDFPILLNTGERILISIGKKNDPTLVTPAGLYPITGWQHIFRTHQDSKHLNVLSDLYLRNDGNAPKIVEITKATKYPPLSRKTFYPNRKGFNSWNESDEYSEEEKRCIGVAQRESATSRLDDIYVTQVIMPSSLNDNISRKTALALLMWLNGKYSNPYQSSIDTELSDEIGWYKYSPHTKHAESEMSSFLHNKAWLPSTKGLKRPSHVFLKKQEVSYIFGDEVPYLEQEINPYVSKFLGIREELTSEKIISYLLDLSQYGKGSVELARRIYTLLSIHEIESSTKNQLLSSNCIAVEENGELKWVTPGLCIWNDRRSLFADQFYYLSRLYTNLRDFFIDKLDVAIDVKDEHFCALWKDIQNNDDLDAEYIESKLTMLYDKLRPLFELPCSKHSDWWHNFLKEAKLWSTKKRFVISTSIYIPDDGNLQDIFGQERVDYLWYPNGNSYGNWHSLHSAFNVHSLKESVSINLKDVEDSSHINSAKYLTRSSKKLILVWTREKRLERFNSLVEKGIISRLVRTEEYETDKLIVSYELDGMVVEASSNSYLDLLNEKLYYRSTACKSAISEIINRALTENDNDESLESWIKGVLGASEVDLNADLKQKNWQIHDEIKQLFCEQQDISDASGEDSSEDNHEESPDSNPDIDDLGDDLYQKGEENDEHNQADNHRESYNRKEDHGKISKTGRPLRVKNSVGWNAELDTNNYGEDNNDIEDDDLGESVDDALHSVFNSDDNPIQVGGSYDDSCTVQNPFSRFEKEYIRAVERNKICRKQSDRYRLFIKKILDGPDPQVREMLYRLYSGKCQICGSTFYQRNGKPFFVSHYLVPRKVSDSTDMIGNSLCLCANHFAQMCHGRLKSPDVFEQLKSIDPENESFELNLEIDGEGVTIKYNQPHAIALKAFYESSKKES